MTGKKRLRRALLIALGVLAALAAVFFLYCSDYYPAGEAAMAVLDAGEGLILLGAYPYGEYPTDRTLTVYGSLNESVAEKIDYTENVVVIRGGNHAQFGDYGPQRGDAEAAVPAEDQRARTADAILSFICGE